MSRISLAEAQARLPELISRAQAGEEVVITSGDGPAIALHTVPTWPTAEEAEAALRRIAPHLPPFPSGGDKAAVAAWLDKVAVGRAVPGAPDAAELVRQTRDEGY